MEATWHKIAFECSCGLPGTILEICVNLRGDITVSGICVVCGKEIATEDNMALLIAKSAISDFIRAKQAKPQDFLLEDFNPTGKPS
jgi:hypothetical protein